MGIRPRKKATPLPSLRPAPPTPTEAQKAGRKSCPFFGSRIAPPTPQSTFSYLYSGNRRAFFSGPKNGFDLRPADP